MICRSCLRKSAPSLRHLTLSRPLSTTSRFQDATPQTQTPTPTPTSPPAATFSTPLSPISSPQKTKATPLPVSICPAGTVMKGINYIKGREDPVALKEEEYPEWLWRVLDVKEKEAGEEMAEGDEFSKSKKLRRKAAKRQRKLLAMGQLEMVAKIPITQQSVDLEGGLGPAQELKRAMRRERRAGIKEKNYLKGM